MTLLSSSRPPREWPRYRSQEPGDADPQGPASRDQAGRAEPALACAAVVTSSAVPGRSDMPISLRLQVAGSALGTNGGRDARRSQQIEARSPVSGKSVGGVPGATDGLVGDRAVVSERRDPSRCLCSGAGAAARPDGWGSGDPGCLVRARVIENRGPVVTANRTTSAAWIASLTGAALGRPPSVPASAAASASSPAASTTLSPPAVKCRATALPMFPASMIAVVIGCPPFVAGPGKWLAWSLPPGAACLCLVGSGYPGWR